MGFSAYLASLRPKAVAAGVSEATFDRLVPAINPDPRVIRLDRAQPGTSPNIIPRFEPYRQSHVDQPRIAGGRRRISSLAPWLEQVQRQSGVPGEILLAIYGQETGYGSFTGRFDLLDSLATLAHEGRRRALFEGELIAAMKLLDQGIARETLKGSWAGATGFPQFLPSVYLRIARDGDGDGKADIWSSEADALASIGAYLQEAGWRAGQPWGMPVTVPATLDRAGLASPMTSPRCPRVHARHSRWLGIGEWRALGIILPPDTPRDDVLASLIEPDGPGAPAFLITGNYRAILDYNCSNFYALSVALLADAIRD